MRSQENLYEHSLYSSSLGSLLDEKFTSKEEKEYRKPTTSGRRFLVSFLVDARGGSMRGSRHPGLRVLVPPSAASAPTRVTCRMLRPERTARPPQLNDAEGLACRIIELGPHPCSFNTPVLLEVPHFASLRGRQRELVVLCSDNGETWKEHSLEATDQAVKGAVGSTFETLESAEELKEKRIIRILLSEFPLYLAVVSRLRQETSLIGSDGGVLSSTVVPQVQAVFPEGALQKRIRVGLQAHPISPDVVAHVAGHSNRVSVSPIVTLEPRRRKFHKPITLTIPLPKGFLSGGAGGAVGHQATGAASGSGGQVNTLRLLCSITGGASPAQWEDITGSTPLSRVKDCVSFTTTLSARFWLMDCQAIHESADIATLIYRESCLVPYMGKFVIFTKRCEQDEALVRCFCLTDDKVDKTLECQEGFEVCAASPEVEIVEGNAAHLEVAGGLTPIVKAGGDQLRLRFSAFRENRLAFPVRLKSDAAGGSSPPTGRVAFVSEPLVQAKRSRGAAVDNTTSKSSSLNVSRQMQPTSAKPLCALELQFPAESAPSCHSTHQLISSSLEHLSETAGGAASVSSTRPSKSHRSDHASASSLVSLHSCANPGRTQSTQRLPEVDSRGRHLATPPPAWAQVLNHQQPIAKIQLDLVEVATEVGSDWPRLFTELFVGEERPSCEALASWIETRNVGVVVRSEELQTDRDRALAVLMTWRAERGETEATGNELDLALRRMGREDVVKGCMRDITQVDTASEQQKANSQMKERTSSTGNVGGLQQESKKTTSCKLTAEKDDSRTSKCMSPLNSEVVSASDLLNNNNTNTNITQQNTPLRTESNQSVELEASRSTSKKESIHVTAPKEPSVVESVKASSSVESKAPEKSTEVSKSSTKVSSARVELPTEASQKSDHVEDVKSKTASVVESEKEKTASVSKKSVELSSPKEKTPEQHSVKTEKEEEQVQALSPTAEALMTSSDLKEPMSPEVENLEHSTGKVDASINQEMSNISVGSAAAKSASEALDTKLDEPSSGARVMTVEQTKSSSIGLASEDNLSSLMETNFMQTLRTTDAHHEDKSLPIPQPPPADTQDTGDGAYTQQLAHDTSEKGLVDLHHGSSTRME